MAASHGKLLLQPCAIPSCGPRPAGLERTRAWLWRVCLSCLLPELAPRGVWMATCAAGEARGERRQGGGIKKGSLSGPGSVGSGMIDEERLRSWYSKRTHRMSYSLAMDDPRL